MNFHLYVGYQTNSNYVFIKTIPFNPNNFIYLVKQSSSWMQPKNTDLVVLQTKN